MEGTLKIMIAAGGTGGHIFPALAIAEEIQSHFPTAQFLFVGTQNRMEARIVPQHGFPFATIWISGFRRGFYLSNIIFPLKVAVSLVQSYALLHRFSPDVVIGTGGFVCGPVLYVASVMKIPTVIHESNSYPGVTTRMLAQRATLVLLAFEQTKKWLRRTETSAVVGTPTRSSLGTVSHNDGCVHFHFDPSKPTVLVMGGSQGAAGINSAVRANLDALLSNSVQLLWQTGERDYEELKSFVKNSQVWIAPFISEMEYAYAAADVVVCRAGAITVAEVTRLGKAAIFVPFPAAAADHQRLNAQMLANAGAAVMIPELSLKDELLPNILRLIQNNDERKRMEDECRKFGNPDATKDIVNKIFEVVQK